MKIFVRLIVMSVVVLSLLVIIGFFITKDYEVERSIVINKHPISVFIHVGDLENWPKWNPWQQGNPSYMVTLGKTTSGVGASQSWASKHGGGELTFTGTSPREGIEYDFRFHGTWKTKAAIKFHSDENGTRVTWHLQGQVDKPLIGGYIALMMDQMVGGMLDYGLGSLKDAVMADERELFFEDEL